MLGKTVIKDLTRYIFPVKRYLLFLFKFMMFLLTLNMNKLLIMNYHIEGNAFSLRLTNN